MKCVATRTSAAIIIPNAANIASGENIQRIVVAGGTARVPGLVDLLREEFAMPVEELNPFRKVLINPSRHSDDQIRDMAPRLAIAVGLALRSFD